MTFLGYSKYMSLPTLGGWLGRWCRATMGAVVRVSQLMYGYTSGDTTSHGQVRTPHTQPCAWVKAVRRPFALAPLTSSCPLPRPLSRLTLSPFRHAAGGAACCLVLWLQFRSSIPSRIPLPTVDASQLLRSVLAAVVGTVVMLTCLALLAAAPTLGWELWAITLVCAGVHLLFNIWTFRDSLTVAPFEGGWLCGLRAGEVKGVEEGEDEEPAVAGVVEGDGSHCSGCSSDEEWGRGKGAAAVEGSGEAAEGGEARRAGDGRALAAGAKGGAAAAAAKEVSMGLHEKLLTTKMCVGSGSSIVYI